MECGTAVGSAWGWRVRDGVGWDVSFRGTRREREEMRADLFLCFAFVLVCLTQFVGLDLGEDSCLRGSS